MKGNATPAVIKIIDITGEELMSKNTEISNGKAMPMDISNLANGIYFVNVVTEKATG